MNFLKKGQELPLFAKKAIVWSAVIAMGSIFLVWRINNFKNAVKNFDAEKIKNSFKLEIPKNEGK